jgi:4-carboxymuconolactone decarboxylase
MRPNTTIEVRWMAAKQDNLDPQTRDLVRFAAAIAQGYEPELRERVGPLRSSQVPAQWVEELLLQSVLMVGYPRALVAFTIWRKFSGVPGPATDEGQDYAQVGEWTRRGEEVCGVVYGENYRKLRDSIRSLHPAVDSWMITEGYGRTLGRPALDLMRRELCVVAQTAVLETPRQLHSHLRGALNAGASFGQIEGVLSIVNPLLSFDQWKKVKELWRTVREGWSPGN